MGMRQNSKVVVAIDSMKGSLSSLQAGNVIKKAIQSVCNVNVVVKPLADGGEGTVEALALGLGGEKISLTVTGPLGESVIGQYGILAESGIAVIEMAEAAGITLVPKDERNPLYTTTYGVGEFIKDAIKKGCRSFIVGIGGSATNDGGIGMLSALGYVFLDKNGRRLRGYGEDLIHIKSLNADHVLTELRECSFQIACDVNNPLYGINGAAHIFGEQKGASEEIKEILDRGLCNLSEVVKAVLGKDNAYIPGCGAAGGLGYAFLTFLEGSLQPGIEIVLEAVKLEEEIEDADIVITGEGMLDAQTAMGKAAIGVAKLAKKYNKKVIAFCGCASEDAKECNSYGIDAYFSIVQKPMTVEEAMQPEIAEQNLYTTVSQVFRLID